PRCGCCSDGRADGRATWPHSTNGTRTSPTSRSCTLRRSRPVPTVTSSRRRRGWPVALELPLARVQRWMQDVVVHPGPVDEAIAAAAGQLPPERLPEVVLPSRSLAPSERVGIYQGMYLLRMEEALESDYPALKRFLGPRGFRALVRDYVASFPSRSYTLNRLGDHLPEFVLRAGGLRHRAFGHDLARLELALTQVFDEAETPPIRPEAVAAVPVDQWPSARLRPIAAFRLLALRHPVNA